MKKPFRLISFLLAVCVMAASFPRAGYAAEGGTIHSVSDQGNVFDLLAGGQVQDGDTIQITGTGRVPATQVNGAATDTPWVIDKNVTITGGTLAIYTGGIVLGADVTFQDISLSFTSNMRNAVIANGHTLTLENVTCANHSFNLFCGGLLNSNNETFTTEIPAPGGVGTIHIKGNVSLQKEDTFGSGNLYAGNLCMGQGSDGPKNAFEGDAVIIVENGGAVGTVYACGAQQRIPVGQLSGKVTMPDAANYTVSGSVTVRGKIPDVEGAGSRETHVTYEDNEKGNKASQVFSNLSSLAVVKGNLELKAGSHDLDGTDFSVAPGAKLNLAALAGRIPTFGSFDGGGFLILHENQTLNIGGTVTGTTSVAIGDTNFDNTNSTGLPTAGHCYIQAPNSKDGDFLLLPRANQLDMTLVRDDGGNWTIPVKEEEVSKVRGLAPKDVKVNSGETEAIVPLNVDYSGDAFGLHTIPIPLTIRVNGDEASFNPAEDWENYEAAGLRLFVGDTGGGDELQIYADSSLSLDDPIPDGIYRIELVVPGAYTDLGMDLSASCTLTVGDVTVSIPVPQAKPGLVWTGAEQTGVDEGTGYALTGHKASDAGTYTATASLQSGYQWEDGSQEDQLISWSIAKSTTSPAAPVGLAGIAPTSADGADGKITGTTAEMEYSASDDFSAPGSCGAGETSGLASGTYYVRVKETNNHVAGTAAPVTVPAYGAPYVTKISIETSAGKTSYQVGEALDVTGLTIKAEYSDGSFQTVTVTADMVDGFDSSQAAERQTLTIRYAGQTTSYEIQITEPDAPDHQHSWSTAWSTSATHHWRSCIGENCSIHQDSEKKDYAAHTAGAWVIDKAATATQSGSRYRLCSVCGYEMARETIPATGGGSSGGGSSGGGSSSGGTSSTTTVKNPNGSTTTTTTNRVTGTVTETTRNTDGSTTIVETQKNGTITTTEKAADGSTVKTATNPDGSSQTTVKRSDGTTASAATDRRGKTEAQVSLSKETVRAAHKDNEAVSLPIPAVSSNASTVEITLPGGSGAVRLEIPVKDAAPGVVAVVVNPDGSETVEKKSFDTGDGIVLTLSGGATVKIVDNSTAFSDVPDFNWAKDAIDFVSARDIFRGTGGREFSPDRSMTRGMLAVVLHNLEDSSAYTSGSGFSDVGEAWYTGAVHWAAEQGIISGYGDGRFGPNDEISREQLAVMLWRYAGSPAATNKELHFADADQASGYALEALRWARENGIMNGDRSGYLMPQGSATRAQTAQMLMNFIRTQK